MNISGKLQTFLEREDILNLLENRKFNKIYEEYRDGSSPLDFRELTTVLMLVEPNMLEDMYKIPDFFLYGKLQPNLKEYLKEFHIPNTITSIGALAFKHCKFLETIHIPVSVTLFEQECLHAIDLKTIVYDGTKEQWKNNIIKEDAWANKNKLEKIIFSDGVVDFTE